MPTSLDAYRSDREQLLARVRELEAEVKSLKIGSDPFEWQRACPKCGTRRLHGEEVVIANWKEAFCFALGITAPKICHGFWQKLACWWRADEHTIERLREHPHFHQRCTACGARWVVDSEGWRFG